MMKRLGIVCALALLLVSSLAYAQCNGVFNNNTVCGNVSGASKPPTMVAIASVPLTITINSTPISGGTNLRLLYDNAGTVGELTDTQVTARINLATAALKGALPAWPNNTTTFFRGDGSYQTLNCAAISGAGSGCSSAAGITALTGDVAATGPGSVAATLATVNANTGAWGSATQATVFTVNGKGLITAAANATITPAVGSITGLGTGVATALAVNIGSAGAPLVFNGALGTPSSGTGTNITGLPISTGVSGLGTGNATALAVNVGTTGSFARLIASGAKALATGAIASATCTAAQTDTATGTATTDAITANFNGDPTAVTGYVPLTTGMLTIIYYPTTDTVNFKVCNNTASSITPGAVTINWRVVR